MANQAIKKQNASAPASAASSGAVAASPAVPVCPKCKGSKRAIFVEPKRGLKSVGPCECVKA